MACPKCGSENPLNVSIQRDYDGEYDPATGTIKVDRSTQVSDIIISCPDCANEITASISNYEEVSL